MIRRLLHPMRFLRRRAIFAGVFGGNRRWLAIGGAAWGLHWIRGLVGMGEPTPRYSIELEPGERIVAVHDTRPAARRETKGRGRRRRK